MFAVSSLIFWIVVTLIVIFLLAPIAFMMVTSFGSSPNFEVPPHAITLAWYKRLFAEMNLWSANDPDILGTSSAPVKPGLIDAIGASFILAIGSSIFAVTGGVLVAYTLVRKEFFGKTLIELLTTLPFVFPALVTGISLLILFSRLGVPVVPRLLIAHVLIIFPYTIRTIMASLYNFKRSIEEAALNLGANRRQTFLRITLPLMKNSIFAGALLAFLTSFAGTFTITFFLYTGDFKPLPIWLFEIASLAGSAADPSIVALGALFSVVVLSSIFVLDRILGLEKLSL